MSFNKVIEYKPITNSTDSTEFDDEFLQFAKQLNPTDEPEVSSRKRKHRDCTDRTIKQLFDLENKINKMYIEIKTNTIIYVRCSTFAQTKDKSHSLETQIALCLDYCGKNNLDVIEIVRDIIPGHKMKKLSLFDIPDKMSNINIVIADPSRLSRNVSDAHNFMERCANSNINIHFARDNLITNSSLDCKKIIGCIYDAYMESKVLSKRLKTTIDMKKSLGSHIGYIPYGFESYYINDERSGMRIRKIRPNEKEQLVKDCINKLYYGSEANEFNKTFRKIINDKKFKLTESDGSPFETIYYGNVKMIDIANFLNEHNVHNRDKPWTTHTIKNQLESIGSYNVKYFVDFYNSEYYDASDADIEMSI